MTSDAIALSDLTFFSKIRFFAGFLLKTVVLFSIFIILIPLKQMLCFFSGEFNSNGLLFFAIIILGYCIVYDIFFIISEGIIKEMVKGMVISLIGGILAVVFPPLGIVLMILGLISMIKQIIGVAKMIPMLLLGALISILLFIDVFMVTEGMDIRDYMEQLIFFNIGKFNFVIHIAMIPYICITFLVSVNLAFKYNLKMALFRQTVIFLAIPIAALVIWLIKTSIQSAIFSPREMQTTSIGNVPGQRGKIWIKPYTRLDGTAVRPHWRSIPGIKV